MGIGYLICPDGFKTSDFLPSTAVTRAVNRKLARMTKDDEFATIAIMRERLEWVRDLPDHGGLDARILVGWFKAMSEYKRWRNSNKGYALSDVVVMRLVIPHVALAAEGVVTTWRTATPVLNVAMGLYPSGDPRFKGAPHRYVSPHEKEGK